MSTDAATVEPLNFLCTGATRDDGDGPESRHGHRSQILAMRLRTLAQRRAPKSRDSGSNSGRPLRLLSKVAHEPGQILCGSVRRTLNASTFSYRPRTMRNALAEQSRRHARVMAIQIRKGRNRAVFVHSEREIGDVHRNLLLKRDVLIIAVLDCRGGFRLRPPLVSPKY
jgi:hypothetical protein